MYLFVRLFQYKYVPWNIWMSCILSSKSEEPASGGKGASGALFPPPVGPGRHCCPLRSVEEPHLETRPCVSSLVSGCTGEVATGSSPFMGPHPCRESGQALGNCTTEAKGILQSFHTILMEAPPYIWSLALMSIFKLLHRNPVALAGLYSRSAGFISFRTEFADHRNKCYYKIVFVVGCLRSPPKGIFLSPPANSVVTKPKPFDLLGLTFCTTFIRSMRYEAVWRVRVSWLI